MLDDTTRGFLVAFLDNNADWDITTTAVHQITEALDAPDGITAEHQEAIFDNLQKMQLANAIAPTPAAVAVIAT